MTIQELSSLEWRNILVENDCVSFFEFPDWYTIWEQYFRTTSKAYLIDSHLLLSCIKLTGAKGFITFYNSSPAGTYSNFRSLDGAFEISLKIVRDIQRLTGLNFLRLSPFSNISFSPPCDKHLVMEHTQTINVGDLVNTTQKWSRNHKRLLDKARTQDFEISIATLEEEWKQYYSLYQSFVLHKAHQSKSNYEFRLFLSIQSIDAKHHRLWLLKRDQEIIAGRLVFYTKDYAVEWHACSSALANATGANQLLVHHILEHAKQSNIKIYDFNPSADLEGVIEFKRKFGASIKPCPVFKSYNLRQKVYLQFIG